MLKGPSYCSGYFNDPEATAEAVDDEGWFHTGDLAKHDEEWYFYIVDRKKDMFISGGENVYPVEIEKAAVRTSRRPHVRRRRRARSQMGRGWSGLRGAQTGRTATEEELIAFMQDHLARYKVPRRVEFLDALPISGAGKILKRELKQQFS